MSWTATAEFQSTLSMRRATFRTPIAGAECDISIHALHEESDPSAVVSGILDEISIHALHEESDRRLPWPSAGG